VLRMEGKEVFRHAVGKLAQTAETALERVGLTGEDVDWIVPHQANLRIIKATAQKMGVPMERVVVTVQDHGNTSAASIPLALSVGVERGQVKPGDLLVMEAIGGGLAWGSIVLRW
jgi:3-oxoacyl-[acyl-carrier-protein] synthase-3